MDDCPCCSHKAFAACCGRFIEHGKTATIAMQLMRSRYSAYALGNLNYILATWHPETRPTLEALQSPPQTTWCQLEIIRCQRGSLRDQQGSVEFIASYKNRLGLIETLHERSRFVRENGHWLYIDGTIIS